MSEEIQSSVPFLEVQDLVVEYFTRESVVHAVNGVSFRLGKGQTLGLVGETGAGKTTIAKSILRILPDVGARIVSGKTFLDGKEISAVSEAEMRQIRGKKISMIFQDPMTALNPVQTAARSRRSSHCTPRAHRQISANGRRICWKWSAFQGSATASIPTSSPAA